MNKAKPLLSGSPLRCHLLPALCPLFLPARQGKGLLPITPLTDWWLTLENAPPPVSRVIKPILEISNYLTVHGARQIKLC